MLRQVAQSRFRAPSCSTPAPRSTRTSTAPLLKVVIDSGPDVRFGACASKA
jgi:hypothetical protein